MNDVGSTNQPVAGKAQTETVTEVRHNDAVNVAAKHHQLDEWTWNASAWCRQVRIVTQVKQLSTKLFYA